MDQPAAELSIMFVGDKKMSELNAAYRGIDRSTDVLAFPQDPMSWQLKKKSKDIVAVIPAKAEIQTAAVYSCLRGKPWILGQVRNDRTDSPVLLGDIVINVPRAESQAKMYGWGFYEEISRLLIHGTLHLLGYDHEKTVYMAGKMRKKEQEILNAVKKMDPKH